MNKTQTELEKAEEGHDDRSNLPSPERRALIGKLAKAAAVVPVATFLYDASNNAVYGSP